MKQQKVAWPVGKYLNPIHEQNWKSIKLILNYWELQAFYEPP